MPDGMSMGLGQLMNPMMPQAMNQPTMPPQSMVAPNAPKQPQMPPPPQAGTPPAGTPPMGTGMNPAIMPQQMPDITSLLLQRLMSGQNRGIPGMDMPGIVPGGTQAAPGLQSAPVRGAPPTVGGM